MSTRGHTQLSPSQSKVIHDRYETSKFEATGSGCAVASTHYQGGKPKCRLHEYKFPISGQKYASEPGPYDHGNNNGVTTAIIKKVP